VFGRNLHANDPELKPMVPVTPMLDMAFQLLSFFLLTFHPDAQFEVEMDLALPQITGVRASDPTLVDPSVASNTDLDLLDMTDVPTITVRAAGDPANRGQIRSLSVEHLGNTNGVDASTDENGRLVGLETALKKDFKADAFKGAIKVRGDPLLKWAVMLKVMDACHSAGFTRVGFAEPLDASGQ
jgi:biopolymer transport protein ExbD